MEKAIKKAIEGGYKLPKMLEVYRAEMIFGIPWWSYSVLDPLFWQALGKAEGWEEPEKANDFLEAEVLDLKQTGWNARWHQFIDHLAEGKDIDSFFNNLLT